MRMVWQALRHRPPAGARGCDDGDAPWLARWSALGGTAVTACAILTVLAGGCASGKVTRIADEAAFQQIVVGADLPVLVDFYKGGCATCVPLDGVMDQLVDNYNGRAVIAKFETMTAFFRIPSRRLKQKYDIAFFPTVILFVNGQERRRWIMRYAIEVYRKELDQCVSPETTQTASAGACPSRNPCPR